MNDHPRETRGYVPAFIGASYAYAYHRQHGIELTESPIPLATDTIRIDRLMHLGQIASTIDILKESVSNLISIIGEIRSYRMLYTASSIGILT